MIGRIIAWLDRWHARRDRVRRSQWHEGALDSFDVPAPTPVAPRVLFVPTIADPTAPTMAELSQGIDLTEDITPSSMTFVYTPAGSLDPYEQMWAEVARRLDAGERLEVLDSDGNVVGYAGDLAHPISRPDFQWPTTDDEGDTDA